MSRFQRFLRNPKMLWVFLPVCILIFASAAWLFFTDRAERLALARIESESIDTLQVQSEAVVNQLEKYRYLPAILAQRTAVQSFLISEQGSSAHESARFRVERLLQRSAGFSGAVDIALADASGEVLLNTNGFITSNMIKGNELRIAPMQGRLGRASISGADGRRTYAFSTAVMTGRGREAIIVVAAPIEGIERAWALTGTPIFATNAASEIVAANPLARDLVEAAKPQLLHPGLAGELEKSTRHRLFSKPIRILGWDLHVLESLAPVTRAVSTAGTIALLSAALAGFLVMALFSRMQQRMRRERVDKANALRLERKVRERTHELSEANTALQAEIRDRREAQAALLKAQKNLIHAEKLAAIGQVSATLAHEYNQPLAAVRTYSENAERYLDRGKEDKARENLTRISALVDRLAHLSRTLLSFASRKETAIVPVAVNDALDDALRLVEPKRKRRNADIKRPKTGSRQMILGERIALGQVFLNLISNAIDAGSSNVSPIVIIEIVETDKIVEVRVADNGSGIAEADFDRIFDPFYTTKEVGEGLGLGLSIALETLQKFGGDLRAKNLDTGAEFTAVLKKAAETGSPSGQSVPASTHQSNERETA